MRRKGQHLGPKIVLFLMRDFSTNPEFSAPKDYVASIEASPDHSEAVEIMKSSITRRTALGGIMGAAAAPHVTNPQSARDPAADMNEVRRIFVDLPLSEAEAATLQGQLFKLVYSDSGIAQVRRRTATGSDKLYEEATTAALASPDGAALVGQRAPYPNSVPRTMRDKSAETVSVSDFGSVASDAGSAFAKAFAAAAEYGRSLYIPKLDAGQKYAIEGDLLIPEGMRIIGAGSGSGSSRQEPGSVLEFEDGGMLMRDAAGVTLDNLRIRRVGSRGPAIDFSATVNGTARNVLNDVSVIGSPGPGVRLAGTWLLAWFNPYIRQCDIGILAEEGAFATGVNSFSTFGGEIQSCATAGIVLDVCKQFNLVGTAVEGNGIGIGLGRSAAAVSILGYFEANYNGHIMPYSHNGGAAGVAQCLVVQGGTHIHKGSASATTAIDIPRCRQFHMQAGVWITGYQDIAEPLIHIQDAGGSNPAFGSLDGISVDCPPEFVLKNDCVSFGEETRRHFYLNATTLDNATSIRYKLPIVRGGAGQRNPSAIVSIIFHLDVAGEGHVVLSIVRREVSGAAIGPQVNSVQPVVVGYNRLSVATQDTDNIAYIDVFRPGQTARDTATGVTILDVEVLTYENRVKVAR